MQVPPEDISLVSLAHVEIGPGFLLGRMKQWWRLNSYDLLQCTHESKDSTVCFRKPCRSFAHCRSPDSCVRTLSPRPCPLSSPPYSVDSSFCLSPLPLLDSFLPFFLLFPPLRSPLPSSSSSSHLPFSLSSHLLFCPCSSSSHGTARQLPCASSQKTSSPPGSVR